MTTTNEQFKARIAASLGIAEQRVANTLALLDGGATLPFISRYRKEATGGLDEVQIGAIQDLNEKLKELAKRKETILSTIEDQGKLTDDLRRRIEGTWEATELEDLYLPYKPKRKTRAEMARQKGLEPLATLLLLQRENDLERRVQAFVKGEVKSAEEALKGARDILAEQVNEDERARNQVRRQFERQAVISAKVVKGKEEEAAKFRDYFDFSEPLRRCSSHRLLALRRGEAEGLLKVSITPDDGECTERLERLFVRSRNACGEQVGEAVKDAYKRLLKPSIETEFAALSKAKADEEAIRVFAENLRQLLLAAPLGQKRVMGIDPGFRTGCKVVCLDAQGTLLHHEAIFPHPPKNESQAAVRSLLQLVKRFRIEAIAIGNGTASRETEAFVREALKEAKGASESRSSGDGASSTGASSTGASRAGASRAGASENRSSGDGASAVQVFVVSEDGASIYSASKTAREEFPDQDVTVRGAVSIGRRLMDPLAELVKIDAKSIGVGQYQHDVDQGLLKKSLDQTVESCVNRVGVNLNTASRHLLTYISGLGPTLAQHIVDYRTANGPFRSRKELLKVPRMGAKAFEQCAGFLRIPGGAHPLDNSAVHPERYALVEQMAQDLHCTVQELLDNQALRSRIDVKRYVTGSVGLPTLNDILQELDKPGRDPREAIQVFAFDPDVRTLEDLKVGMELPGIVTNLTNFGCFVDLGVKEKGLVHVSQLADHFVSDPTTVVRLHQQVRVKVMGIDLERRRIQLTMKGLKNQ